MTCRQPALLAAGLAAALVFSSVPATAATVRPVGTPGTVGTPGIVSIAEQAPGAPSAVAEAGMAATLAQRGRAAAAARGVQQSVAVIDRTTGALVASAGGREVYNTESILKLFTAAYYLVQADGEPDGRSRSRLRALITVSDNDIQSALWDYDIIPSIVERYGLSSTRNGPNASPRSWGSDRTTADDQVRFLAAASRDPLVGPFLLGAMADTEAKGADGVDQDFGLNALTGVHGSKQGWSDPGWTPANMHSVGYTAQYFVAILQTSPEATYATMRATATATARSLASLDPPVHDRRPGLSWHVLFGPVAAWGKTVLGQAAPHRQAAQQPA